MHYSWVCCPSRRHEGRRKKRLGFFFASRDSSWYIPSCWPREHRVINFNAPNCFYACPSVSNPNLSCVFCVRSLSIRYRNICAFAYAKAHHMHWSVRYQPIFRALVSSCKGLNVLACRLLVRLQLQEQMCVCTGQDVLALELNFDTARRQWTLSGLHELLW